MRISIIVLALIGLAGCFGPVELPLLADVELAEGAPESGLVASDTAAAETVLEELDSVTPIAAVEDELAERNAGAEAREPEKPRRGLFALFGGKRAAATNPAEASGEEETAPVGVESPSASALAQGAAKAETEVALAAATEPEKPHRQRRGLLGPRRTTSRFPQVEPGVVLPYGQIGLACGIKGRALGQEVDRFPEKGKGYRLFDTNPSTTGPRTHFLTGFKDGCPRQFTASLALLGSPVLHEQLPNNGAPHLNAADKAYASIRAQICRVGRGKPCPEGRIGALEKSMAFVTTYERFGGNASWEEILLHNGSIAATSAQ